MKLEDVSLGDIVYCVPNDRSSKHWVSSFYKLRVVDVSRTYGIGRSLFSNSEYDIGYPQVVDDEYLLVEILESPQNSRYNEDGYQYVASLESLISQKEYDTVYAEQRKRIDAELNREIQVLKFHNNLATQIREVWGRTRRVEASGSYGYLQINIRDKALAKKVAKFLIDERR